MSDMAACAAFIRARLDEDEQTARQAAENNISYVVSQGFQPHWKSYYQEGYDADGLGIHAKASVAELREYADHPALRDDVKYPPVCAHITRHDPARVLAQVAAMRAIVDDYERYHRNRREHPDDLASAGAFLALHGVVKRFAAIWDWHADYDPA